MAVLTIGSENPKFSWIIQKNPNTIRESKEPYKKEIRKGVAYGWFPNDQQFRLWFKDNPLHCSFAEGIGAEFEYLDRTRYASPYLPISLITNCLATAFKQSQEEDEEHPWSAFMTTTVEVRSASMIRHITEYFNGEYGFDKGYSCTLTHLAGHAYDIHIQGPSIHKLLNAAMVIFLMLCVSSKGIYVNLKGDIVEKYIKSINIIEAPYFIRYLFKRNVFSNRDTFLKNKALLDTSEISLWHGDTLTQRKEAIFPELDGGHQLIDIGCGELNYSLPLAAKYESVLAFESDDEVRENAEGKAKGRQVENISFQGAATPETIADCELLFEGADVLITEVLEHIPLEDAKKLVIAVLNTGYNKIVITVPNKDFNIHYKLDGEFRHDDHKWEMGYQEFIDWLWDITRKYPIGVTAMGIGDAVNGVSTSTLVTVIKN
jgi:small RNA 2'-O-methyltransferase